MRRESLRIGLSVGILLAAALCPDIIAAQTSTPAAVKSSRTILARVNAKNITQTDLERIFKFRNVSTEFQPKLRAEFIEVLIESELMQQYLKSQKVTISPEVLNEKVKQVRALLSKEDSGEAELQSIGFNEQILKDEIALPLKWQKYVVQTIPEEEIEQFFKANRVRFDRTQLRASQIFLPVESMADPKQVAAGLAKLQKIRQEIVAGLPFADAAKKYSKTPSSEKGGDVGYFQFEGKMSPPFVNVAFKLPKGEISQPFAGIKGVHLCVVTEREEGTLSLEDVRMQVMEVMSNDLWKKRIKELKAKAKIEHLNG